MIEDAKLFKIGDSFFVRGKFYLPPGTDTEDYGWLDGAEVGVDWSTVRVYYLIPKDKAKLIKPRS